MRIGHQLFEFLLYCTDTRSYCVQETHFFIDKNGKRLFIKEIYINDEENQVYLIIEDENQDSFHTSIHNFITMMGGANPDSYAPLYKLRDETKNVKKAYIRKYKNALNKYEPKEKKLVKQIFRNLFEDERD